MTEHFQYMRLPKRICLPQGFLIICLCLTEKILRVSYRNLDIRFFSGMEMQSILWRQFSASEKRKNRIPGSAWQLMRCWRSMYGKPEYSLEFPKRDKKGKKKMKSKWDSPRKWNNYDIIVLDRVMGTTSNNYALISGRRHFVWHYLLAFGRGRNFGWCKTNTASGDFPGECNSNE